MMNDQMSLNQQRARSDLHDLVSAGPWLTKNSYLILAFWAIKNHFIVNTCHNLFRNFNQLSQRSVKTRFISFTSNLFSFEKCLVIFAEEYFEIHWTKSTLNIEKSTDDWVKAKAAKAAISKIFFIIC